MADANVDLNDVLGSILIGTWLNAMLYMLEITQVIHYFQNYSNDRPIFKIAVATVFILDTVCTVAACASAYLYSVVHWGDRAYLAQQYWPIPMYIVTTGTCGAIVQFFMLSRYWILTKRKAVASVIIIGIIVTWGGSIYSASKLATFSDYSQRKTVFVSATSVLKLTLAIVFWILTPGLGFGF
ncbi:hypothetical protein D9758_008690 [Tetrapyrgos nigripes]|uniref:Uncharacterized protein n=1 Tax=Tetrapyrgos nigripes TaxID=182062 RepID=A0A8H5D526_9AGAR|nr:hypothetical protein D9758_008690 [Tetrapyrgos nigripes]